jgi:hypothetical protein
MLPVIGLVEFQHFAQISIRKFIREPFVDFFVQKYHNMPKTLNHTRQALFIHNGYT